MCYEILCNTVDPTIPVLCPDCMVEQFDSLTEEDLYEMYSYFITDKDMDQNIKEIFFVAFNKLMLLKKEMKD